MTRVNDLLDGIDAIYVRNGLRPVAYELTDEARAIFDAWYQTRTGSIFERRLDTYGHRLMLLLAASSGRHEIDGEVAEAVVSLLGYQLDVRRECDPVDADNAIAKLEEKIRRALARGAVKGRDLKRKVNYQRVGIWAWDKAIDNLVRVGEVNRDPKTDTFWLMPELAVITSVITAKNDISANGDAH